MDFTDVMAIIAFQMNLTWRCDLAFIDLMDRNKRNIFHLLLDKMPPFRRRYFPMYFCEWKFCILIEMSLKFVPRARIVDADQRLNQCWPTAQFNDAYMRH